MFSPPSGEAEWRRTRKRNKTRLNCCGQHATSLREVDSWQTREVKRSGCELEQQNEGQKMTNELEAVGVSMRHLPVLGRKVGKGERSTTIDAGKPVSPRP
jgi:protein tyrosine phosphatase (PTP) superfamily phosphohydrolase (DUF442 family)